METLSFTSLYIHFVEFYKSAFFKTYLAWMHDVIKSQ